MRIKTFKRMTEMHLRRKPRKGHRVKPSATRFTPGFAYEDLPCYCRLRLGGVPAVDLMIRLALTETGTAPPTNTCDGR